MLFSICMPAYNAEKTIEKSINSVLNQNFVDYELLIVNDGSTDSTEKIIRKYMLNNKQIRLISDGRLGLLKARVESIKNANGEYIIFLDSDDVLYYNALYEISCEVLNSKADMIQYESQKVYSDGRQEPFRAISMKGNYNQSVLFDDLLFVGKYTTLWNKAIKRKCFDIENLEKCDNVSIGEDNIILLLAARNINTYAYIAKALHCYYIGNGITNKFRRDSYSDHLKRMRVKRLAIIAADKQISEYEKRLDVFDIMTVAKIVAYFPSEVEKKETAEADYNFVLCQIRSDKEFWKRYKNYKLEIGMVYRLPLFLLKNNCTRCLLCYKRICVRLRKAMM